MNGFQLLQRIEMYLETLPPSFNRDESIVLCYACEDRLSKAMRAGERLRYVNLILD